MPDSPSTVRHLQLIHTDPDSSQESPDIDHFLNILGIKNTAASDWVKRLPFSGPDTTAGSETELQTVVMGPRDKVDLPISIEDSNYFRNIVNQASSGEAPIKKIAELEAYLNDLISDSFYRELYMSPCLEYQPGRQRYPYQPRQPHSDPAPALSGVRIWCLWGKVLWGFGA